MSYRFLPSGEESRKVEGPARIPTRNHPLVQEALELFEGRIVEVEEG